MSRLAGHDDGVGHVMIFFGTDILGLNLRSVFTLESICASSLFIFELITSPASRRESSFLVLVSRPRNSKPDFFVISL